MIAKHKGEAAAAIPPSSPRSPDRPPDVASTHELTLLSWNVAALRGLIKGPNPPRTWLQAKFKALGAPTVVCLQETKVARDALSEDVAIVEGYHAFFAHAHRGLCGGGYSGVATYVDKRVPVRAATAGFVCCAYAPRKGGFVPSTASPEAGTTTPCPFACAAFRQAWEPALMHLDMQELEAQEQGEEAAALGDQVGGGDDEGGGGGWDHDDEDMVVGTDPEQLLRKLDLEGRTVLVDIGTCVIVNVYCPFRANPSRARFKKAFNAALTARCEALAAAGREIILCGDLNAIPHALDTVEPPEEEAFLTSPWVRWMGALLAPRPLVPREEEVEEEKEKEALGPPLLVDTFRELHPTQQGAYTCWCNQTGARATNYGRRIDYILASPAVCGGPVAHLTDAAVRQEELGSDHCPVTARFSFPPQTSPFLSAGLDSTTKPPPLPLLLPPLCTATFPEFRAKQMAMHTFLSTSSAAATNGHGASAPSSSSSFSLAAASATAATVVKTGSSHHQQQQGHGGGKKGSSSSSKKRSAPASSKVQLTLAHFGMASTTPKGEKQKQNKKKGEGHAATTSTTEVEVIAVLDDDDEEEEDDKAHQETVAAPSGPPPPPAAPATEGAKRQAFLQAFKPRADETPRCRGHKEPMVRRCVKKADSEHVGRYFWCCARPEGTKGDKEARCSGLVWEDEMEVRAGGKRVKGLIKKRGGGSSSS